MKRSTSSGLTASVTFAAFPPETLLITVLICWFQVQVSLPFVLALFGGATDPPGLLSGESTLKCTLGILEGDDSIATSVS